ncbi:MAG: energy-coupling factor transporter transmembrane component T [Oscillospiraceae bacterium]
MKMNDILGSVHPINSFIFFVAAIGCTMIFIHPIMLAVSLVCGLIYATMLKGIKSLLITLVYMIPMFIFVAMINPLFNHRGVTILFYLNNGNAITLESIIYGIASSTMLMAAVTWFSCLNCVISSDKIIYLFGKVIPATSLMLCMVFRFVPKFKAQVKVIVAAQKCIGNYVSQGNVIQRLKCGITILSLLITWALENSIQTADSMKSRGYGLSGRTSFSNYRFCKRDAYLLTAQFTAIVIIAIGSITKQTSFKYFPAVSGSILSPARVMLYFVYALFLLLPVILMIVEEVKWRYTVSKI